MLRRAEEGRPLEDRPVAVAERIELRGKVWVFPKTNVVRVDRIRRRISQQARFHVGADGHLAGCAEDDLPLRCGRGFGRRRCSQGGRMTGKKWFCRTWQHPYLKVRRSVVYSVVLASAPGNATTLTASARQKQGQTEVSPRMIQ